METIFAGQEYFGMAKQNRVAKEQFLKANPGITSVFFMYSYMPHKPVVYGLTEIGYFEGNFTFGAIAGLKNYTSFQSYPYSSIKELIVDGGALHFKIDLSIAGAFLVNKIASTEIIIAPSSVTPGEIETIIAGIHEAQTARKLSLARVTTGPVPQEVESEAEAEVVIEKSEKPVGDVADELLKAKNLLDLGAISEEEFAALKKKIMGL